MIKDSESYREAYASQSRSFQKSIQFKCSFRIFQRIELLQPILLMSIRVYLFALSERHSSSHQCSRPDLDDDCCFQGFSLACWHYGGQPVQEGSLFGSPNSLVECCFSDL